MNCWHESLTFRLELSFRISRLKSPVIKILEMLVSKASPIESSIDDKIAFVELGGSVERTYELYFVFDRNFYPEALNIW